MIPETPSIPRTVTITRFAGLLLLLALACPAVSSAQSGSIQNPGDSQLTETRDANHGHPGGRLGGPRQTPGDDGPVAPVPEPGTMALVGMGVVALGAAVRKRIRS